MSIRVGAFLLVGFLLAAGSVFFALKKSSPIATSPVENKKVAGTERMPWIEVVRPQVVERGTGNGEETRILKTGDEVALGKMIETDAQGIANIYFPDGSVLRLDTNTKIVLDEARLNPEDQELIARIFLSSGRVWSKVLALLTPSSLWEVKTSNAVATVRGTAFGVSTLDGKTSIIGAERTVAVRAIDPETRKTIGKEVVVAPDKLVEILQKDIALIQIGKKELAVEKASEKILADPWIKNAKEEDRQYDERIKQLKAGGLEERMLRQELQEKIRGELKTEEPPAEKEPVKDNLLEKSIPPEIIKEQSGITPQRPATLTIRISTDLQNVIEGKRIKFSAMFTGSDGQMHDVTTDARWMVIGSIGTMVAPGIFFAQLGPDVSEFGSASGTITAIWKNPKTGEAMLAKSPVFRVEAKIEEPTNTDG